MTTPVLPTPDVKPASPDRWRRLVIFLTLVNTALVAAVAALQTDASIRTSVANRAAQYLAIRVSGELLRTRVQGDYDTATFSQALLESQEANILDYTALQLQMAGDDEGYQDLMVQSQVAHARADQVGALSVFLMDPRYAPAEEFGAPDIQGYLDDLNLEANRLVGQQNEAADAYHRWNSKADAYVAILTILAIAFFLLGISQTVQPGLRLLFAGFAGLVMGIGLAWSLVALVF